MAGRSAVVADAGPLIALARIDSLHWINLLAQRVVTTAAVVEEIRAKPDAPESAAIENWLASPKVTVMAAADQQLPYPSKTLGEGELSCIRLAKQMQAAKIQVLLLMDDQRGRAEARANGLALTGTAGLIAAVRRAGVLPSARDCLNSIRADGYYLSDDVIDAACVLCGE